jgi:hypothetical protein
MNSCCLYNTSSPAIIPLIDIVYGVDWTGIYGPCEPIPRIDPHSCWAVSLWILTSVLPPTRFTRKHWITRVPGVCRFFF